MLMHSGRPQAKVIPNGLQPACAPLAPPTPRVLVVDDHDVMRQIASTLFRVFGCHVVAAADGEQAIRMAKAERFNLIVMDRNMPGCGGDIAALSIRSSDGASQSAFIACHSTAPPAADELGPYDCVLTKPPAPEAIIRLLAAVA